MSADDTLVTAWYLRFTKLNAGSMQLDLFVPSGAAAVTPFEFAMQNERTEWNRCVSSHESYRQFTVTADVSETLNGTLDTVNIFSNVETADTEQLGPVEWLEVKAVRIE